MVTGRALPRGRHVHPAVVPLEDALGVGDAEEGGKVVPGVGDEASVALVGRAARRAAAAGELIRAAVGREHRVLEEGGDGAVRVQAAGKARRTRHDTEGADLAQVGDHDTACRGDGGTHLGRGGLSREPDHGEPEGVPGGKGRSRKCKRGGKRCKQESGPLHRLPGVGTAGVCLHHSF